MAIKLKYYFLTLLGLMVFLIASNTLIKSINTNYHDQLKNYRQEAQCIRYNLFINKGNKYLKEEKWELAQYEFVQAIKLEIQNKEAVIGLSKSLNRQCQFLNNHCEEAEKYRLHLAKLIE